MRLKQTLKSIIKKPNFSGFSTTFNRSKKILLGFFIFVILLPIILVIPSPLAMAQSTCDVTGLLDYKVESSRTKVGWDEPFEFQVIATFKSDASAQAMAKVCESSGPNKYKFKLYLYTGDYYLSTSRGEITLNDAQFFSPNSGASGYGYAVRRTVTIKELAPESEPGKCSGTSPRHGTCSGTNPDPTSNFLYAYLLNTTNSSETKLAPNQPISFYSTKQTETPKTLTALPGGVKENQQPTGGSTEAIDYTKLKTVIKPNANGKGLRSKYRVAWTDGDLNFGKTLGLEGVHVEWADQSIDLNQQFILPAKDNGYGFTSNPYYSGTSVGFNYASNVEAGKVLACQATLFDTDCKKVIFRNSPEGDVAKVGGNLPTDLEPVLKSAGWKKGINPPNSSILANGNAKKPLGSNEFVALPVLTGLSYTSSGYQIAYNILSGGISTGVVLIAGQGLLQKVTVEVYATEKEIIDLCKDEQEDDTKCTAEFARYQFADTIEQTTNSAETTDQGAAANLFGFLARVVSYIILLIISAIYYIFAYIIVPVLTALLSIHPWKDEFVDFIYPGWVIMRNLTNIVFIAALLYMGLQILFQIEDASKSRSFIIRLILMALLVNFSLVIGQGVVAIADTVQAQFLPADSKVVEALGVKLMVDPIKTFRGGGLGDTASNLVDGAAASDIPKSIILLVLAIAAFFCFVAIIAFVLVRLVALWILYMLSPLGYVAYILPQTQQYAKQWWDEFIKYTIMVPVLAFFLNIAALMATVFSTRTGDAVSADSGSRLPFLGLDLAGELVEYVTTVASHFIVLLFIFIGMKYALKSGTVGSKEIVGAAKKGFDALTTRPAKWMGRTAKDGAKSFANTQYERRIAGGLLDPKAWKDSYKDKVADTTSKMKSGRLQKKSDNLSPDRAIAAGFGGTASYALHKAFGLGPQRLQSKADDKAQEASILTAEDRAKADQEQRDKSQLFGSYKELKTLIDGDPRTGKITKENGQRFIDRAKQHVELLDEEIEKAEEVGNGDLAKKLTSEKERLVGKVDEDGKKQPGEIDLVEKAVTESTNGFVELSDGAQDKIAEAITDGFIDAKKNFDSAKTKVDNDNEARKKFGYDDQDGNHVKEITEAEQRALRKEAEYLSGQANDRKLPESLAIKTMRIKGEKEAMEKYEEVDDPDELIAVYKKAMDDNNLLLASAMAKKLAQEGSFKDLLAEKGYRNNMKGLQDFVASEFKGASKGVQLQILSEVGSLNAKNGNAAASKATKIDATNGRLQLATEADHNKKNNGFLSTRTPQDLNKLKTDQVMKELDNGLSELYQGYVDNMNDHIKGLNASNDLKGKMNFANNISAKMAKKIMRASNFENGFNESVKELIRARAEGKKMTVPDNNTASGEPKRQAGFRSPDL